MRRRKGDIGSVRRWRRFEGGFRGVVCWDEGQVELEQRDDGGFGDWKRWGWRRELYRGRGGREGGRKGLEWWGIRRKVPLGGKGSRTIPCHWRSQGRCE